MKIVYEDGYFLAVDKPAGIVVHRDGRTIEPTLSEWILEYVCGEGGRGGCAAAQAQKNIGNPHTLDSGRYIERCGIINRLDRDTSGIVLIAKDNDSFLKIQKQFLDQTIQKEYLATVWGDATDIGEKKVTEPISRHKKDPRIWVCGSGVGERSTKLAAETDIKFFKYNKDTNQSELLLKPKTGRTHQLRLHTRFLGHPIVGDIKYGIAGITNEHSIIQIEKLLKKLTPENFEFEKNTGLHLHAAAIELLHPHTGHILRISTQ